MQDLQQQLQAKEEENEFVKRKVKNTKLAEYEIELETMREHMQRLRMVIKEQREKIKAKEN